MINIQEIMSALTPKVLSDQPMIEQRRHEEGDGYYEVWNIIDKNTKYILKCAKKYEADLYARFFRNISSNVPKLYASTVHQGKTYLLLEYCEGTDLCQCDRRKLILVLDALIALQKQYWENREMPPIGLSFDISLSHRRDRGRYLGDTILETAYEQFLALYESIPRTLCHDDLLPFNLLISDHRAVLIDWEIAGILPYPTSLARLIAHTENKRDAFFYMSDDDRTFAIQYYYDRLIAEHGISYADFCRTLDYFLLYEYCEWIMLGNKFKDADMDRYHTYQTKAKKLLNKIGNYTK